ncbi:uncharacterized protein LOC111704672 [Eurytemora carolleeae]|uniref:uncharacterized protein LOC111704672 n=1 Tax=Eurytemora carolleeae TaxID=1294199 RepID=UPI000C767B41|nr:uncharacterized protein LOC111704672 [Eurytemora carolleeae]|eukprot:XP_023332753.1 uncharacterized protein LOC111704672 [Eurytemora affinis]
MFLTNYFIFSLKDLYFFKGKCERTTGDLSDNEVFQDCKLKLARALGSECSTTTVVHSGDLLYCKNQKLTVCCFHNHNCSRNWDSINDDYVKLAVDFLTDQKKWLEKEKTKGYESCHPLGSSLDASKCQKDCQSLANSEFAQNCKKDGGFFKCCVRRDGAHCHECRFCCTLLMCTIKTDEKLKTIFSTYEKAGNNASVIITNTTGIQNAKEVFYLTNHQYKSPDYRCLNTESHSDPTEWGSYNPHQLADAANEEELKKVLTIPFDKRFLNFEDPKILKLMIGKNLEKHWKETYGFDFAAVAGDNSGSMLDCYKAESGKYAKSCKKKGGLFKCCANTWDLDVFTEARQILKEKKLISSDAKNLCQDPEKCRINTNAHLCSINVGV